MKIGFVEFDNGVGLEIRTNDTTIDEKWFIGSYFQYESTTWPFPVPPAFIFTATIGPGKKEKKINLADILNVRRENSVNDRFVRSFGRNANRDTLYGRAKTVVRVLFA